jgi:hypothetical protein
MKLLLSNCAIEMKAGDTPDLLKLLDSRWWPFVRIA